MAYTDVQNNYPNPLDNYRSYSYHFILTVASNTEAFREMMGNKNDGMSPLLQKVNDVKLGDEIKLNNETAYLLVDTRRFSQYSITELEMDHIYGTGSKLNPTVPLAMTKMKLIDTTGLSFFNFMMDTMRNKVKSTRASAFFMLAVLFVGHNDDGSTTTISTCYIPLNLLQMSFEFTSSGSVYSIDFMETEGGPGYGGVGQQLNYLGDVSTISTKDRANTLGGLLSSLEEQLNVQSLAYFQKYSNDALKLAPSDVDKSNTKLGKLVQYMITIPDEWAAYVPSAAARSKNIEQQFIAGQKAKLKKEDIDKQIPQANVADGGRYSEITFSPTTTITDAIKVIMECSEDLLKEASEEKRLAGKARAFKTVVGVTSDDTTFTVHFDIYPYSIPSAPTDTAKKSNADTVKAGSSTKQVLGTPVKNLITYDYIFTGKNSHITDLRIEYSPASAIALDTNLDFGRSRFASNAEAGQKASNVADVSKSSANKSSDFSPQLRPSDPIFKPIKTKDQQNNNTSQKTEELTKEQAADLFKAKQEYTQTFAFLHFLSSMNLQMSVRGNPNIIKKFADRDERGGMPPHTTIVSAREINEIVSSGQSKVENTFLKSVQPGFKTSKQYYVDNYVKPKLEALSKNSSDDQLLNNIDINTLPVFVKVNILAPNVDWTGEYKVDENMFTNEFFYDGVYHLISVKTIFANGEFTHNMSLIPYDVDGSYSKSGDGPNK